MNIRYLLISFVLFTVISVHAVTSAESVVVRVAAYNAASRTYTFTCDIPLNADPHRYWTIRPDTPELETQFYTDVRSMTYTLSKDVMYHIGCQVNNGTSTQQQWIRGDFHIDRRKGPNTNKPDVTAQATSGTSFTMTCTPPPGVTQYDITWRAIGAVENVVLPSTQNTIKANVPHAGLWDMTCGIWDRQHSQWSQWGFPTEFFASGQAYTPTASGCIPGECGTPTNTTNATNTTNPQGVSLSIAPWYPQGRNYVFVCKANATSYNFMFGDGQQQLASTRSDAYHTYVKAGNYQATCSAKGVSSTILPIIVK